MLVAFLVHAQVVVESPRLSTGFDTSRRFVDLLTGRWLLLSDEHDLLILDGIVAGVDRVDAPCDLVLLGRDAIRNSLILLVDGLRTGFPCLCICGRSLLPY